MWFYPNDIGSSPSQMPSNLHVIVCSRTPNPVSTSFHPRLPLASLLHSKSTNTGLYWQSLLREPRPATTSRFQQNTFHSGEYVGNSLSPCGGQTSATTIKAQTSPRPPRTKTRACLPLLFMRQSRPLDTRRVGQPTYLKFKYALFDQSARLSLSLSLSLSQHMAQNDTAGTNSYF